MHSINASEIPLSELKLKVGFPVMILCNLDPANGFVMVQELFLQELPHVNWKYALLEDNMLENLPSFHTSPYHPQLKQLDFICHVVNFLYNWHLQ